MSAIKKVLRIDMLESLEEVVLKSHKVDLILGGTKVVETIRRETKKAGYFILECGHTLPVRSSKDAAKTRLLCYKCKRVLDNAVTK